MTSLGDRMKGYEKTFSHKLMKRNPIIIRLDGKAFHTFTNYLKKPFDYRFIIRMIMAAKNTCNQIQGFKCAYVQSDEISILCTDYDKLETEGWFDYKIQKIASISAAFMSVEFINNDFIRNVIQKYHINNLPVFDSRVFSIPKDEVVNYFLWRSRDWKRNSIQMYARKFFSHKELQKKKQEDIHEMLHKIGKNWTTDLSNTIKNGTFFKKYDNIEENQTYRSKYYTSNIVMPTYESISIFMEGLF